MLVLAALGIAVAVSAFGSHGATTTVSTPRPIGTAATAAARPRLYIHLIGAIARPGLYILNTGDRVVDAVAAAGGFTAGADQGQVNLARVLADGEQVIVPAMGEASPVGGSGVSGAAQPGAKVNINTADETALETLPRVGPAMAARIVEWRKTNGRFAAIEDLMSVTGIGQKTFDGFKDHVTV